MAKTDFTKVMQDMMGAFPMDTKAMQDAFKTQAVLGEKMSKVVLEAAEKSAEVSNKWTKSALAKIGEVSTVKEEPADYAKSMTDFASARFDAQGRGFKQRSENATLTEEEQEAVDAAQYDTEVEPVEDEQPPGE